LENIGQMKCVNEITKKLKNEVSACKKTISAEMDI
jgi:hypothetical protein